MRTASIAALLFLLIGPLGCKKNAVDENDLVTIDDWCPGQPHCTGEGNGVLQVGAASRSFDPVLVETDWVDDDLDGIFDPGESFTDTNGNGVFDAYWIAGFGNGRPATGFHDTLEVRALALQWNDVSVVIAYIDAIGMFEPDLEAIRNDPVVASLGVDHLLLGATHMHQGPDTVGLWGPDEATRGVNPDHMDRIHQQTVAAIVEAVGAQRPARMAVAQTMTVDGNNSTLAYVNDVRDPIIYDPTLTLVRFVDDADPNTTIATLINWAAHPEYAGGHNNLLTADYPHLLRDVIEDGDPISGTPGLGGTAVFVQGPLGGQIGPGGPVAPLGTDGTPVTDDGLLKADAAGRTVALLALSAIQNAPLVTDPTPIRYRTAQLYAEIDNELLRLASLVGIIERETYLDDKTQPISDTNVPYVRSRTTYLQVGPVAMITAPGELHPELWVGGYDGSWSFGNDILNETENAPDLSQAPKGPYLRDLMLANDGVEVAFVAGLGEDFLGYIVPAFNYVLDEEHPYFEEAAGDHYEETYSLGPRVEEQLQHPMMQLATFRP